MTDAKFRMTWTANFGTGYEWDDLARICKICNIICKLNKLINKCEQFLTNPNNF